jgi:hypothetical protein
MNQDSLSIENHGSVVLFRPLTDAMNVWLREHTDPAASWFGGALAVEPRYAEDLLRAIREGDDETATV